MPVTDPTGGLSPAPVAQSLVADTQNTPAELIRLRRVVGDAAQTLAGADQDALHGHGRGEYRVFFEPGVFANGHWVFPDTGTQYRLSGTVDLAGLGHFEVSGSVQSVAFNFPGNSGGELTFSNACGSLTLRLVGPEQAGGSNLPGTFHYRVTSATGAYRGLQASGELLLALKPGPSGHQVLANRATVSSELHLALKPGPPDFVGTFTLTFGSAAEMTSGIRGMVLEGPISPVDRQGIPNTQPLPGAIISVRTADGRREVARVQADGDGQFQVFLRPGVYRVVALPPEPGSRYPRGTWQVVHIVRGESLDLTMTLDTGIR
jgi:hypothetical protein